MKIVITGGAGFLGQRLAQRLIEHYKDSAQLILLDRAQTNVFAGNSRVQSVACDVADAAEIERWVSSDTTVIYHLAAIVSSQAEAEFDLGMKINLDATRALLERCRQFSVAPKFIFASSIAVFGGELPPIVTELTATRPQSSYGAQKAMGELLVNEFSRRGFVDGRVVRLPTISVRPGKPNRAASSFVSGIIREPLSGLSANCPVGRDVSLWISSPSTAAENLWHAHLVSAEQLGPHRTINLPGITVTVGEMIETLTRVAGPEVAGRITYDRDATIERIVTSWPGRFDASRARTLGFQGDQNFEAILRGYQREMV